MRKSNLRMKTDDYYYLWFRLRKRENIPFVFYSEDNMIISPQTNKQKEAVREWWMDRDTHYTLHRYHKNQLPNIIRSTLPASIGLNSKLETKLDENAITSQAQVNLMSRS